ncbi:MULTISPECIES: 50S ribosomal protein L16 [unclassified Mycoplasma]|uniref:50S ribosomal protein L16 n=1 Tax=unclassified Mycoplasma TaxID=2683645 RepID=UPI000FDD084E
MLQPKRTKYRKPHNIYPDKKNATKGNKVEFGEFGLQAQTAAWVTSRQIEAARIAITRRMGREGQVIIRIFPHLSKTAKPIGVRMGKGKGSPEKWVAVVRKYTVMFEVLGVDPEIALAALRLGGHKLPVKWKILTRPTSAGEE